MSKKYLIVVQAITKELFGLFTNKNNYAYTIFTDYENVAKQYAICKCAETNEYVGTFEIISSNELIESNENNYYVDSSRTIFHPKNDAILLN